MEQKYYSVEKNVQILISLLKQYGVKKIVISPGATNMCFAYSVQHDGAFELFSSIDERSAAYMACGLCEESGEPVVLSCTGATASRNYIPGLTEAYYRHLPVIAVTSTQPRTRENNIFPQYVDRSVVQKDIVKVSEYIPTIHTWEEERFVETAVNRALIENMRNGCGPVHINLETEYSVDYSVKTLPVARKITWIDELDKLPEIPSDKKIGIFVGNHHKWSKELTDTVDVFCDKYNAVVLCDQTSNYKGKKGVLASLITSQENVEKEYTEFDILIHIGQVSGAYLFLQPKEVWRVSEDGKISDLFWKLKYAIGLNEESFFKWYLSDKFVGNKKNRSLSQKYQEKYIEYKEKIGDIPFSNIWVAGKMSALLPKNSELHLGILNSLRSWNFYEVDGSVQCASNTGGFGIDGNMSSLLGASLIDKEKMYFAVVGDLSFCYDLNSLGNRHVGKNLRIMLINNGCGTEFKNYNNWGAQFGSDTDAYVAAKGHFKSCTGAFVKDYVQSLGYTYLSAKSKDEFLLNVNKFISDEQGAGPIVFEVFTDPKNESDALKKVLTVNGERCELKRTLPKIKPSDRFYRKKWTYVMWGTGKCFSNRAKDVLGMVDCRYVCDNSSDAWGKTLQDRVVCVSPKELMNISDPFVIVMVEDAGITMQIVNQLIDMGINDFDTVHNFVRYEI